MMIRTLKLVLVCLAALAFLARSLSGGGLGTAQSGGLPLSLCIGCGSGSLGLPVVSPPCQPAAGDYCGEVHGQVTAETGTSLAAPESCGCIDVPLDGDGRMVLTAKAGVPDSSSCVALLPEVTLACLSLPDLREALLPATRAGPWPPPMLPISRCTVLVL